MGRDCSLLRGRGVAGFPLAALFCTAKRTGGIRIEASGKREVEGLLICLRDVERVVAIAAAEAGSITRFFEASDGLG